MTACGTECGTECNNVGKVARLGKRGLHSWKLTWSSGCSRCVRKMLEKTGTSCRQYSIGTSSLQPSCSDKQHARSVQDHQYVHLRVLLSLIPVAHARSSVQLYQNMLIWHIQKTQQPCHMSHSTKQPQTQRHVSKDQYNGNRHIRTTTPGHTTAHKRGTDLATGNTGDVEAVIIALDHVLLHPYIGDIVMVALLHRPVCIVHGDPLRRRQSQPDLQHTAAGHHVPNRQH